ncbi:hypothetical protein BDM02DRAFT_3264551 [Thelephora ganbajun]|uniref:Uncharacterized protein n=1 Tax=Thelephora ganbajun TaxID=370292 RepID=A0ACB6YY54_THEGA|nr:hypothetical protein BDM02DRAFT_3264551 [Thelephora ganbajun]
MQLGGLLVEFFCNDGYSSRVDDDIILNPARTTPASKALQLVNVPHQTQSRNSSSSLVSAWASLGLASAFEWVAITEADSGNERTVPWGVGWKYAAEVIRHLKWANSHVDRTDRTHPRYLCAEFFPGPLRKSNDRNRSAMLQTLPPFLNPKFRQYKFTALGITMVSTFLHAVQDAYRLSVYQANLFEKGIILKSRPLLAVSRVSPCSSLSTMSASEKYALTSLGCPVSARSRKRFCSGDLQVPSVQSSYNIIPHFIPIGSMVMDNIWTVGSILTSVKDSEQLVFGWGRRCIRQERTLILDPLGWHIGFLGFALEDALLSESRS